MHPATNKNTSNGLPILFKEHFFELLWHFQILFRLKCLTYEKVHEQFTFAATHGENSGPLK